MGTVAAHVDSFLSAIDPEGGLLKITDTVADLADANQDVQDVQKALTEVSSFIKTLPIDKERRAKHKQLDKGILKSKLPASSEAKTLLAAGFLKAKEALRRSTPQQLDKGYLTSWILGAPKVLRELESAFVGELLLETDNRANRDQRFAKQLAGALAEFEAMIPSLKNPAKRLRRVFEPGTAGQPQPSSPATAAAIIGDYDCGGGVGDALCAGALVVAIVIIIAVAK